MEAQTKTLNFIDSFRPVYYISRIFGLMPFTIIHDANGEIQKSTITKLDGLWLAICVAVYFSMGFCIKIRNGPLFFTHLAHIFTIFGLIYSILTIVINMYNRSKFIDILKRITNFDNEMTRAGMQFNYRKNYRRNWLYCTLPIFVALAIVLIGLSADVNNYTHNDFLVFLQRSMLHTHLISFIILLHSLYERFALINIYLRNRFLVEKYQWQYRRSSNLINDIKFIGHHHSSLVEIVDHINYCYAFQMIFNTAFVFGRTVFILYTMNEYIFHQNVAFRERLFSHFGWILFRVVHIIIAVHCASLITREAKITARIVHDIVNCCNFEGKVESALGKLSQQLLHRHPIVSSGLFTYDWSLIFAMIAATTIYLTILLNFEPVWQTTTS